MEVDAGNGEVIYGLGSAEDLIYILCLYFERKDTVVVFIIITSV